MAEFRNNCAWDESFSEKRSGINLNIIFSEAQPGDDLSKLWPPPKIVATIATFWKIGLNGANE